MPKEVNPSEVPSPVESKDVVDALEQQIAEYHRLREETMGARKKSVKKEADSADDRSG